MKISKPTMMSVVTACIFFRPVVNQVLEEYSSVNTSMKDLQRCAARPRVLASMCAVLKTSRHAIKEAIACRSEALEGEVVC